MSRTDALRATTLRCAGRVGRAVRRLLPPGLLRTGQRLLPTVVTAAASRLLPPVGVPEWEYVPEGWRVEDRRLTGWNAHSVLDAQRRKWPQFVRAVRGTEPLALAWEAPGTYDGARIAHTWEYDAHNTVLTFGYVLCLAARAKDRLSLLDWGGGLGHYYALSKQLAKDAAIDYHCKDVPVLCQAGRELVPEASFYEDEEECFRRTYDLVLASGSLQQCEDWRNVLKRLARVSDSYLYVTRLPIVHRAASFVVVHRPYQHGGYQIEYLNWHLNRTEFIDYVSELGMELVREFLIMRSVHVHGAPEDCEYRGYLFRPRRDPSSAAAGRQFPEAS